MPVLLVCCMTLLAHAQNPVGLFENADDVGAVIHKGKTVYDSGSQTYRLSGAGGNIWFDKDEFHFAYKKLTGDFIVRTRAKFIGEGIDPHRKLGWMVRTGLDTGSPMVCATVHGDGLTSFQYRKKHGADAEEIKSPVTGPDIIQLERRNGSFLLSVAKYGDPFWTVELPHFEFPEELFTGLFVCSHNADVIESADFENVRIVLPAPKNLVPYKEYIGSHLERMEVATGKRKILHTSTNSIQAPNWTPNNKSLIYNSEGLIYHYDLATGKIAQLDTDFVQNNNNDHVLSFDGQMLGISSASGEEEYGSLIYTLPVSGGKPKRITSTGPSYLHGWSPDGKWLTYTGGRNNIYDIYKIASDGSGKEIQLTNQPTLDDGSEYSPDGKYIYFNSARTGSMELWRMKPDGSQQEQLTNDRFQNWFPHISPDGQTLVFLSYAPEVDPGAHPFYKQVYLRTMPVNGGRIKVVAYLYGGQGTINVPSWSPDSKHIAFISNTKIE
ncbi:Periplasmic component of the Tol biopolymer transport system [Pseudozobellia thermophila]|uniref:Periplasmic component of the Tol biopolymer transport system n=2 Tax=Pseudozobellia thermophila TaxID=192903 RepID=A0A1M6NFK8_9FLAO|nr:Periplasmic component of the Tol biopolymer transport system [Pseudozobellia thermophila]